LPSSRERYEEDEAFVAFDWVRERIASIDEYNNIDDDNNNSMDIMNWTDLEQQGGGRDHDREDC
jgi:hypothetical protein